MEATDNDWSNWAKLQNRNAPLERVASKWKLPTDKRFADADAPGRMNDFLKNLSARLAKGEWLMLGCWCAPEICHGHHMAYRLHISGCRARSS
eukprot:1593449-Prymnesium_polylepis.1